MKSLAPKKDSELVNFLVDEISKRFELNRSYIQAELATQTGELRGDLKRLSRDVEEAVEMLRGKGSSPGIRQELAVLQLAVSANKARLDEIERTRSCYYAATTRGKYSLLATVAGTFLTALGALLISLFGK